VGGLKEETMKKIVWLYIGMLMLGLSACGKGNEEQGQKAAVESGTGADMASGSQENAGTGSVGGESNNILDLKTIIIDTIGKQNYYPDMAVEAEQLEEIFGITSEMYKDFLGEVCQDGTNVDTLLIIEAKDDKVEAVQEAMFTYRDAKEKATLEDSRNIGKVRASRIETNGNYVSFVQLGGDVTAALTSGEDAVIEQCLQMNELVLEVIAQNVH
jgi:hypothetical protein